MQKRLNGEFLNRSGRKSSSRSVCERGFVRDHFLLILQKAGMRLVEINDCFGDIVDFFNRMSCKMSYKTVQSNKMKKKAKKARKSA